MLAPQPPVLACSCALPQLFNSGLPFLLFLPQGLDDAFVSQAPILGEEGAEDLYDPSDPTDRQQIEWRQTAQEKQQQQQAAEEEAAGGEGASTPARATSSAAGDLASHGSETTQGISGDASSGKQLSVPAQLQKDAFLVFRALCKLSIRSTEAAPGSEITTIRGKVGQGWEGHVWKACMNWCAQASGGWKRLCKAAAVGASDPSLFSHSSLPYGAPILCSSHISPRCLLWSC